MKKKLAVLFIVTILIYVSTITVFACSSCSDCIFCGGDNTVHETYEAPTCTEYGFASQSCQNCSYSDSYTMSPLGHNYVQTYGANGWFYICIRCGDIIY